MLKDIIEIVEKIVHWLVSFWRWLGSKHEFLGFWVFVIFIGSLGLGVALGDVLDRWRSGPEQANVSMEVACAEDLLVCAAPQAYQPGRSTVLFVDRGNTVGVTFNNVVEEGRSQIGALILRLPDPLLLGAFRAIELCAFPKEEVFLEIELKVISARTTPDGGEVTTIVEFLPQRNFPRGGETCRVHEFRYRGSIDELVLAFDQPVGMPVDFDMRSVRLLKR